MKIDCVNWLKCMSTLSRKNHEVNYFKIHFHFYTELEPEVIIDIILSLIIYLLVHILIGITGYIFIGCTFFLKGFVMI